MLILNFVEIRSGKRFEIVKTYKVRECVKQIQCEDSGTYRTVKETIDEMHKNAGYKGRKELPAIMRAGANARLRLPSAIGLLISIFLSAVAAIIALTFIRYSIFINNNSQIQPCSALMMCIIFAIPFVMLAVVLYVVIRAGYMFCKYIENSVIYEQIKEIYKEKDTAEANEPANQP